MRGRRRRSVACLPGPPYYAAVVHVHYVGTRCGQRVSEFSFLPSFYSSRLRCFLGSHHRSFAASYITVRFRKFGTSSYEGR